MRIFRTFYLLGSMLLTFHISVFAQGLLRPAGRADFFINTNDCLNCHMFLKTHTQSLQNSDTLVLHLDNSARNFGAEFLEAKGIARSLFREVVFENLITAERPFFDSYIILQRKGIRDSILIREPARFGETSAIKVEYGKDDTLRERAIDCGILSNRITHFTNGNHFYLSDYLFQKVVAYAVVGSKILNCNDYPYNLTQGVAGYTSFLKMLGYNFELTEAMMPLFRQLDMAKVVPVGVGIGQGYATCGIIEMPYAVKISEEDTALGKVIVVIDEVLGMRGALDFGLKNNLNRLVEMNMSPLFAFGVGYRDSVMYIPLVKGEGNYQADDKFVAHFILNSDGFYVFEKLADFRLPEFEKFQNVGLSFERDVILLKYRPYFFHISTETRYYLEGIKIGENQKFVFHSAQPTEIKNIYRICYQIEQQLFISLYDLGENSNEVISSKSIGSGQYVIVQTDGVFIFGETGPAGGYSFVPYK